MIFEFIQHLNMKLDESKPFREIFYPDLYAEAGEGDLAEYADAAPEQDDDDIGSGMEKRSSRAHALRVRSGAAFHALRHNTNYLCRIRMQHAFCIRSAIIPAALDTDPESDFQLYGDSGSRFGSRFGSWKKRNCNTKRCCIAIPGSGSGVRFSAFLPTWIHIWIQ